MDTAKALTIPDTGEKIPKLFSKQKSEIGEGESQGVLDTKCKRTEDIFDYIICIIICINYSAQIYTLWFEKIKIRMKVKDNH